MTGQLGRRRFLTFVVAAPTLTVAARLAPAAAQDAGNVGFPHENWAAALTPLVKGVKDLMVLRVEPDGRIVYELPRCETGQGINTAIAMMIAEELDARLDDLDVPHSDGRPELGVAQLTGWSTTVQNFWDVARELGAEARARLVTAAAHRWNVDASTLTTRDSTVNAPDGRSATYGSLAVDAANVDSPEVSTKPKPVSEHRLIGEPTGRMDARDIVTGKATYTMDLDVPGALPTVVKRPPTLGGRVGTVHNAAEVEAMPGVVAVTTIVSGLGVTKWPTGVAITAHSIHQALQARDALTVSWDPGPIDGMSDEDITQRLRLAVPPMDPPTLLRKSLVGEFDFGFVNHAPVETNCAIADVRPTHADIWLSAKIPLIAQLVVKAFIQRPVTIHVTRGGGSFGRKLYPDVAIEAALTSAAIGKPVKLLWTRDDDMRHGRMRPASHHRIRFTYLGGTVYSLENWSSAVQLDVGFNPFISELLNGVPLPITGAGVFLGTENTPYDFGVSKRWLEEVFLNIPTAMWRAFYAGHNGAAEEISVDRLAGKLGKDPLQFRIDMATDAESVAVLRELKARAGWGRAMPPGWVQGVAFHRGNNSLVGCVVEMDATDPGSPRVTKAVMVADVGRVINPTGAKAQLMGGLIDGISTILQAGNHLRDGAIVESSFADFRYARQKHAPLQFDAYFVNTERESGGMGELGVGAASGAVANAYARATCTSPSRFPILA